MTTVLWARHGENVANITRTFSHRVFDGGLTAAGRRQAADLADRLADRLEAVGPVGYLACSPLRRARQTAQIVGARLGLAVALELDDLRELDVGALDGRSDGESWRVYQEVLAAWRAGCGQARFPGGEDREQLQARLRRALTAVALACADGGHGAALVVAHGACLRAALPGLAGVPDPGTDLPTGAVAELKVQVGADRRAAVVRLSHWPA